MIGCCVVIHVHVHVGKTNLACSTTRCSDYGTIAIKRICLAVRWHAQRDWMNNSRVLQQSIRQRWNQWKLLYRSQIRQLRQEHKSESLITSCTKPTKALLCMYCSVHGALVNRSCILPSPRAWVETRVSSTRSKMIDQSADYLILGDRSELEVDGCGSLSRRRHTAWRRRLLLKLGGSDLPIQPMTATTSHTHTQFSTRRCNQTPKADYMYLADLWFTGGGWRCQSF